VWPALPSWPGAYDYLAARPDQVAVLFTVELCSLTSQLDDDSTPALVGSALFGHGAACVVLAGAERDAGTAGSGPRILGTPATGTRTAGT
jgi:alkylresorcinol/alkylpyrone synthase